MSSGVSLTAMGGCEENTQMAAAFFCAVRSRFGVARCLLFFILFNCIYYLY